MIRASAIAMTSNNNIELDFEGEFAPIKPLSLEELQNDRLIKRIKLQKKLEKLEDHDLSSDYKTNLISEYEDTIAIDNPVKTYEKRRSIDETSDSQTNKSTRINIDWINAQKARIHNRHVNKEQKNKSVDEPIILQQSKSRGLKDHSRIVSEDAQEDLAKQKNEKRLRAEKLKNFKLTDSGFDSLIRQSRLKEQRSMKGENEIAQQEINTEPDGFEMPREYKEFRANENDVNLLRKQVLSQLVNKTTNFPNLLESPSLISKYKEVYKMFEHTVRDNEGHSLLIIGPRSSGKTAIIQHALDDLSSKYPGQFITVRLNAYLHSDDIVALREVARQLDYNAKQLRTSDDVSFGNFEQRSISDTFTNILSILDKNNNNNANNNEQEAVSIIFIIEEFENFTSGSKQTLLYNLFDLSQSSSTPICVVGVSTKITARELLEKRVRSRFSQRIISINKSNTIEEFWANAKLGLVLSDKFIGSLGDQNYGLLWNQYVESMYSSKSSYLRKLIFQNYFTIKNFKDFNNNCVLPVSKLSILQPFPEDADFKQYSINQSINNIQSIVMSLSVLELLLIIAATRWIEKFDLQVVNFNLAYKEYDDMIKNFNINAATVNSSSLIDNNILSNITINQKIWSPKILKNCWESLYKLGLLLDYGSATTNADGQVISTTTSNRNIIIEDNKMVQLDITLDELHHLIDDLNVYRSLTKL